MPPNEFGGLLFNIPTPLGFSVQTSADYWAIITQIKHPVMRDRLADVEDTLRHPDEIRRSRSDSNVYLFYQKARQKRWTCAVVRRLNGDGFLVTAYPTSAIKAGETLWQK